MLFNRFRCTYLCAIKVALHLLNSSLLNSYTSTLFHNCIMSRFSFTHFFTFLVRMCVQNEHCKMDLVLVFDLAGL